MGPVRSSLPPLVPVLALLTLVPHSESKVTLKDSPSFVQVVRNENGLLECEIAEFSGSKMTLQNSSVLWSFTNGAEKSNAFVYISGVIREKWKEAELLSSSITHGNMSLLLKDVAYKHAGQYQCEVYIPPNDKATKTVTLEVIARPTVIVTSEKTVEVGTGGEMALSCQLSGYFPCESNTEWLQTTPAQGKLRVLTDVCIAPPVKNPDGTCNISTEVRLEPGVEDIGSTFTCRVFHKSFTKPYQVEALVTLKEAEIHLSKASIIGSIIGSIITSVLVLGLGIYFYMRFYYKVAPYVSEIQKPVKVIHREPAELTCQVSGFQPSVITIAWYLKRLKDAEMKLIAEWQEDNVFHFPLSKAKKIGKAEKKNETDDWKVRAGRIQKSGDGTFSISSVLEIYPDIFMDNEAEITCKVIHPSNSEAICKKIKLHVDGIPPKLARIIKPPVVLHNSSVMLTCPIICFKPRPVKITWYKNVHGQKTPLLVLDNANEKNIFPDKYSHYMRRFNYSDCTVSVYSTIRFNATIQEEDKSQYFCAVEHIGLTNPVEEQVQLDVKAFPSLDAILSDPVNPVIGEMLTLTCRVHSFYPESITVHWLKDDVIVESKTPKTDLNSKHELHEFISSFTITPTVSDLQSKYKCQVDHESLMYPRFAEYIPENLVSHPTVSEITCSPDIPEVEKELTLTCTISDYYPNDIQVEWFRNEVRINSNVSHEKIEEQSSCKDGLHSKVTMVTLTPSTDDHQAEYRVEVCHSKSSTKPIKKNFQLTLKGSPKFSVFVMEPENPSYGKDLSVSCSVSGISHPNVTVEWYKASQLIHNGVTKTKPILTSENTYKVDARLKFFVTAEDFEGELFLQYKDNDKGDTFKRDIHLPLQAVTPEVSEIECQPAYPRKGERAILYCKIDHFCPVDILVVWSKGWTECKDEKNTETPKINEKGLYSTVTHLPIDVVEGRTEYICEVRHLKTNDIVEKTYVLHV
ncbi:uncharacterized protein LOC125459500 [Stegostoma tigrinum]|uniref:uncharacterized protein LOC125459500 n=1 Tax=Stegostoma tigrinum TaxID=3053191 RepID=UPI00287059D3|nr:uncharacterized protein LOC125459500 [Stegostoma tigrinum]